MQMESRGDGVDNAADVGPLPEPPSVQAAPELIMLRECRGQRANPPSAAGRMPPLFLFVFASANREGGGGKS